jgi:hypothetical protein
MSTESTDQNAQQLQEVSFHLSKRQITVLGRTWPKLALSSTRFDGGRHDCSREAMGFSKKVSLICPCVELIGNNAPVGEEGDLLSGKTLSDSALDPPVC